MAETSIQWTDHSINPIRARLKSDPSKVGHYCEKVSPGCANCYSSNFQKRFGLPAFGGTSAPHREEVELFLDESKLHEVLRRKKPTKYFWCDMTDLFGKWVPVPWIIDCFAAMALTPHHTHQLLTKRPDRASKIIGHKDFDGAVEQAAFDLSHGNLMGGMYDAVSDQWPMPNVWIGTSVENQAAADERIPLLLQTPAAVRFLSVEPILSEVNLYKWLTSCCERGEREGESPCPHCIDNWWKYERPGIHWVIVGGESGPGARPCNLEWLRSIVRQCRAAAVPPFAKQVGANPTGTERDGNREFKTLKLIDRKGGDMAEWPEDLRVREFPR